ncbi:MAG: hypothetical protein FD160_1700 [Caulobacteraceae bacterium]|nr:MAG: hypothetical protein FD160_1700 [Caulobacteraceae bacterium]
MQIFTPVTRTDLQAHAQRLRLWLLEVAVWLVEAIGFREGRIALSKHRIEARRELRELLFLMMCARMRFRKAEKRRRWLRPPSTPSGFRYAKRRIDMVRLYTRGIALRTFAQMRRALDDLGGVVERAIARVPKTIATGRLVLSAAAMPVLGFTALTPAAKAADTS